MIENTRFTDTKTFLKKEYWYTPRKIYGKMELFSFELVLLKFWDCNLPGTVKHAEAAPGVIGFFPAMHPPPLLPVNRSVNAFLPAVMLHTVSLYC